MIQSYIIGGALAVTLALGAATVVQTARVKAARAEVELLQASLASMQTQMELAKEAREVADARRQASEAKAREYDKLREEILRDGEDADLPEWMLRYLERMLGPGNRAAGDPSRPD